MDWKNVVITIIVGDYHAWYTVVVAQMEMGINLKGYCVEAQVLERFLLCISLTGRRCRSNLITAQWI
jgi:hypothetical protein